MKRHRRATLMLCTLVLTCAGLMVYAADTDKKNPEFRNRFVKEFQRTGLNTTPGDAMMLRILVESSSAQRGVEVGSASGFGAVNMGIAFERTGGHLHTLEIDSGMVKQCRDNLQAVGLENTVTCIEGDALQTLKTIEGPIDFVFIDAVKSDYLKYLKLIEPKLGAVVVGDNVIRSARAMGDNVIRSARAMRDFLDYIQTSPDYDTVIIRASMEKNDGMSVSYKIR